MADDSEWSSSLMKMESLQKFKRASLYVEYSKLSLHNEPRAKDPIRMQPRGLEQNSASFCQISARNP